MKYKPLGNTGLYVSEMTFGTMTFNGKGTKLGGMIGETDQAHADRLVKLALDAGINLFDTANGYGQGDSEIILGKALKASGVTREDYLIATKIFMPMGGSINSLGLSRLSVLREVDKCLERLDTNYIDLFQAHGFDTSTPIEETFKAFDSLIKSGKVRYIGLSNFAAWQIIQSQSIAEKFGLEKFCSAQIYYSLVGREVEREILPAIREMNLGTLVWSPLAGGFLTGKYSGGNATSTSRRKTFEFPPVDKAKGEKVVEILKYIARKHGHTEAQIALAWLLHKPDVTSVIIGATKEEQLIANIKATQIELSCAEMRELDAVSELVPEYPNWARPPKRGDKMI
ncbi:aldo/keto reductase [Pseudovibrio ascidiaceicola]|uniref:aldo/keto reductase n=1 Tax=Pseudovibrio ascidiaceicola TaxID=285279 RepID=UPI000D69B8D7|nr:aldo/keto reductase [Pseudovibrio ascidiaceicola]